MMKKFLFPLFLISLLFFSCKNVTVVDLSTALETEQNEFVVKGTFTDELTGAVPQEYLNTNVNSLARTAIPSVSGTLTYSIYTTVNGTKKEGSVDSTNKTYTIALAAGTYTLTLDVSSSGKVIFTGTTTIKVLADGSVTNSDDSTTNAGKIKLNFLKDALQKGNIELSILLESAVASKINSIQVEGLPESYSITTSGYIRKIVCSNVVCGSYPVTFKFYNSSGTNYSLVYSFTETINVFSNLTTDTWYNSSNAPYFNTSNNPPTIEISSTLIQSYSQKVFYVSSSGNDSKSGSFFEPVKTINQAITYIKMQNDSSTEYEIVLLSDITCSDSDKNDSFVNFADIASATDAINVKISSNGSNTYKIDANGSTSKNRVMYIGTNNKVTLKNVELTGGYVPDSNATGSGIYFKGSELNIDNALINGVICAAENYYNIKLVSLGSSQTLKMRFPSVSTGTQVIANVNGYSDKILIYDSDEKTEEQQYCIGTDGYLYPLANLLSSTSTAGTYYISSENDLIKIRDLVNDGTTNFSGFDFVLTKNVVLSADWEPIGTSVSKYFSGKIYGNGKTVRYSISSSLKLNLGLFGYVKNAEIKDLTVAGTITPSINSDAVGGLVSYAIEGLLIDNCVNEVNISGNISNLGGIFGQSQYVNSSIVIRNCTNKGVLTNTLTTGKTGGIVGYTNNSISNMTIINCINIGDVSGSVAAGIMNSECVSTYVKNCVNIGTTANAIASLCPSGVDKVENCFSKNGVATSSVNCSTFSDGSSIISSLNNWITNSTGGNDSNYDTYKKWAYDATNGLYLVK